MFEKKVFIFMAGVATAAWMWSCGPSRAVKLDPATSEFYETARLIMTDQEKKIFNHMPSNEDRKEFIQEFWDKRDPSPDQEVNEFKQEFYRRIEYANTYFKEGIPGWKTDRGRIYIYFGPPDRIERRPMLSYPEAKGIQVWVYYNYNFGVEFIDKRGDGSYTFDPYSGVYGSFFDALEMAKLGLTAAGSASEEWTKKFMDFKLNYDKRNQEIQIFIPADALVFVEEDDFLTLEFQFKFYVYKKKGPKLEEFEAARKVEITEQELLDSKELKLAIPYSLSPGAYYFDVVVSVPETGRVRKIFNVKV
ncbi:MAG: GWxTD domain-containing protein [Candidatus Aminicenantes bacterium]